MSKNAFVDAVQLLGRLIHIYDIDITDDRYDSSERELLEQAIRDYQFYGRSTDINGFKEVQASTDLETGTKRKPGRPKAGN